MGKRLSIKYGQKLLDSAKISTTDAIKTASARTIQKTAEATGDVIGNRITDNITIKSLQKNYKITKKKKIQKELLLRKYIYIYIYIYISRRKITIFVELRLVPKKDAYF